MAKYLATVLLIDGSGLRLERGFVKK